MSKVQRTLPSQPIFDEIVPLVRPVLPDFEELAPGIKSIIDSKWLTKGERLRTFERAVAEHLGVSHAIAVSSCTTGLMLTYRCLGLSGEVIVPSFTFMATISAAVWAGLRPVFADVHRDTFNLDAGNVEKAITPQTSAIVATHIFGNPADIEGLQRLATRHELKLVFDAAHGFGTLYRGKPVGPEGNAQVYSLSPTKLLIAGEGGIVATDDDYLAERIKIGREYGNSGDYDSAFAGMNARMPEINALLGLHSLGMLEAAARRRNEVAALYRDVLSQLPGIGFQMIRADDRCSYKDFSITIDPVLFGLSRDDLVLELAAENVDTRTYYDPPAHRQTAYTCFDSGRPLPMTDLLASRSISLPLWSDMTDQTARAICRVIENAWEKAREYRYS